ncbi:phage tail tape measure protein [Huintestinicola sp.]|uniref:phage tail tape measure protein n=1 Tax=Huintestinicola sp. TaxID=2981661 RepID=UPI00307CA89E
MSDGFLIFDTRIDTDGVSDGLRRTERETEKLSGTAQAALGNLAANAARDIANAVAGAFKTAAEYVVETGSSFEASMSQVAATMGITAAADEYGVLSAAAKEMGATTKYSATQAGEALNYLALAGYDAQKSVEALPVVLNTAAAGGIDLAYASDMITDSMSALGLQTNELAGFSDKLAKTSQKSNTSVAQLGEAILTVGGTAKSLSGGVEELDTMLGLIADNGIKGAEGGTALRNIILSLSAPTDTAAAALENLGIKVFDDEGKMRDLADVFSELDGALAPLTEQKKTQALSDIFNKVDLKAVNALLGTTSQRFEELRGYISDCDGAAEQMAKTMDDNFKGDITIMQSALEAVGVTAFEKFSEPLRTSVQEVTGIFGDLNEQLNGELGGKLETLAEKFGDLAVKAAEFAVDEGIPKLIDGLDWFCDNGDQLITAAETAGAMVIAYKGLSAANTAATAVSSYAAAASGAATATGALGIAMNAVPWVAVGTLAIGGGVALASYIDRQRDLIGYEGDIKESFNDANREIATQIQLLGQLSDSNDPEDNRQAYEMALDGYGDMEKQVDDNNKRLMELYNQRQQINIQRDNIHNTWSDPEQNALMADLNAQLDAAEQEIEGIKEQNIYLETALISRKKIIDKYSYLYGTGLSSNMDGGAAQRAEEEAKKHFGVTDNKTAAEIVSQEQINEELKNQWQKLDHEYAMGIIADEDALYQKRLEMLRKYGDESNTEHWGYYEKLRAYEQEQQKKALDDREDSQNKAIKSAGESLDDLNALYQKKYSDMLTAQSDYRSRLMAVGGSVFSVENETDGDGNETTIYKVNDIEKQIAAMEKYHADIKALKEDGASAALLEELNSMSAEDGAKMAEYLAGMSEEERQKVIELYKRKEQIADDLSADLYAKDAENMQNAFAAALTDMGVNAYDSGAAAAEQFASGFGGKLSELMNISAFTQVSGTVATEVSYKNAAENSGNQNVNVNVEVTGGDLTLDSKVCGEYSLDYTQSVNVQKGR